VGLAWHISRGGFPWAPTWPDSDDDSWADLAQLEKLEESERDKWVGKEGQDKVTHEPNKFIDMTEKPKKNCRYSTPNTVTITYGAWDRAPAVVTEMNDLQKTYEKQGYYVDNHEPDGKSAAGGDTYEEIVARLKGKRRIAIWAHAGHGWEASLPRNGTLTTIWNGNLVIRDGAASYAGEEVVAGDVYEVTYGMTVGEKLGYGASNFANVLPHKIAAMIKYACYGATNWKTWKSTIVSSTGVLKASSEPLHMVPPVDHWNGKKMKDY
jgi:hypothetical protein